jgi:putative ABC transport system permease protein
VTATLDRPPADTARAGNGGGPARRAMVRWAWRLFRREWRQQFLILALVVVALGATVVGSAVSTTTPPSKQATFGTAQDAATFAGSDTHLATQIAALRHRFGPVDVIENETRRIPGSTTTFQLRAQDPHGPYGQPLLSLVSGRYPSRPDQVALTSGLATDLGLQVGDVWHEGGTSRTVVGIVENPQSLLDEFALVLPGQVTAPTRVTVLFDAHGVPATAIGSNVRSVDQSTNTGAFNPTTIVLALATVGMLLIALVGVGGFTVLAQRRLRSIGMLESLGATDRHVRLVVRANGVVVGVVGAVVGTALGIAAWLAYRPILEQDAHHVIGVFALPWAVILPAMALAVLATYFAASRPARSVTRVPVVAALSGRPAPPRQVHRSVVPGVVLLALAAVLFALAASRESIGIVVPAFVALIAAIVLLAPFCLAVLGRVGRWFPVAVRLALRDLARYRARSASALAAISLGILIAVVITTIAAGRYGNPLDYAGANLAPNQAVVHVTTTPTATGGGHRIHVGPGGKVTPGITTTVAPSHHESPAQLSATAHAIAAALGGGTTLELETTAANLLHAGKGRNWNGQIYVATPALLREFGIKSTQVNPGADILSMRPGLATESKMLLVHGGFQTGQKGGPGANTTFSCPRATCLANPVIQEMGALPSGTSAPNTVITEHAVRTLHLQTSPAGWFVQTSRPPSASQISDARSLAASTPGLSLETKSSAPSSSEVTNWATVFGIALALGILAMSVGLIRSETAADLRTLTAAGASSFARRTITAATAGGLALLGAVLGTVGGYVAVVSWFSSTRYTTGLQALSYAPVTNLLAILIGMPLLAIVVGWLLAGREPRAISPQAYE